MEIDRQRIETYLDEIANEAMIIRSALEKSNEDITKSPLVLRGLKYSIVLISEAIANVLQHILAKKYHVSINGYTQCFTKARDHNIISEKLFDQLKPFSSFRNMLVHQYWRIDDKIFLANLREGIDDFQLFIKEILENVLANE
ncbi:MAG: DUF86 domain-containing protein [Candidatus Magnetomorum sp.]|nr:DUF86 domain-containing protein [Candidatus Magnetomorum sp.]